MDFTKSNRNKKFNNKEFNQFSPIYPSSPEKKQIQNNTLSNSFYEREKLKTKEDRIPTLENSPKKLILRLEKKSKKKLNKN